MDKIEKLYRLSFATWDIVEVEVERETPSCYRLEENRFETPLARKAQIDGGGLMDFYTSPEKAARGVVGSYVREVAKHASLLANAKANLEKADALLAKVTAPQTQEGEGSE